MVCYTEINQSTHPPSFLWVRTAPFHPAPLTVCVFQRLLLLRGLGDHLDEATVESAQLPASSQHQPQHQPKVLPLIGVGDVQGLGTTKFLRGSRGCGGSYLNSLPAEEPTFRSYDILTIR